MRISIILLWFYCASVFGQSNIGDFQSLEPLSQSTNFLIPTTHQFQKLIEQGDPLTEGGTLQDLVDFTGYVPINGSSTNGYLSINSELSPGGLAILEINLNPITNIWEITSSQNVDFASVEGTARNCSGTVTPWNTVITSEEVISTTDNNIDGYYDLGWNVEIDPVTKSVIGKLWALGNFRHENVVVHTNERTVYQGADSNPGYLYKFVADNAQDLSSGLLYVYSGLKDGPGNWILLDNTTTNDRNTTLIQSANVGGTVFNGIEDVEIGPNGWVYFTVKGENQIYRFQDSDPITGTVVTLMETYVGNMSYQITHPNGVSTEAWGAGNDNLAFDGDGNLWVLQDGGKFYIWVVENGHTQLDPKVKIFGNTPTSAEPTGITFSPDYKYLFMSIQHPNPGNGYSSQMDVEGNPIGFEKDITLVISRVDINGPATSIEQIDKVTVVLYPNPFKNELNIHLGKYMDNVHIELRNTMGSIIVEQRYNQVKEFNLHIPEIPQGIYIVVVRSKDSVITTRKVFLKR
ncbi:MAG: DUF839 domain-containing protein [Flavobacteriales bacterium]|nr:DUF839 domain-containing protein [Flavobacteriales bacterium]